MSHLATLAAPLSGNHAVRHYQGFGVFGADIPSAGTNGPSPVLNDSIVATSEYYWRLVTPPATGVLKLYADLSFEYTPASDGTTSFTYQLFEDGADSGTGSVTMTSGSVSGTATGLPASASIAAPAASAAGTTVINGFGAGSVASVSVIPTDAVGSGTSAGNFSGLGAPASLSLSAPAAVGIGTSIANGSGAGLPAAITVTVAAAVGTGTASGAGIGTGTPAEIVLTPPSAYGYGTASGGGSISQGDIAAIAAAVLATLNATTIPVDVKKMNSAIVTGDGQESDPWRGVGVSP